jgi:glycolate oxidase iron-sulfur subunit
MDLRIDDDELSTCVSCGLCLAHCPTYRVTGIEMLSPRGRISAMRAVQRDDAPIDDDFLHAIDTCVQCRGCETACPSGVPFGHLIEATRATLAEAPPHGVKSPQPWWRQLGYRVLEHPRVLRAGTAALAIGQRLRVVPSKRLGLPARLPLRQAPLVSSGGDVVLFTGCVMDAWQRDVHAAVQRVVERAGARVSISGDSAPCCGALHEHAGLASRAHLLAERVIAALPGEQPILVDSAGCGAMLKDYGRLLDTPAARAFSARVLDVHEWLAERIDALPAPVPDTPRTRVVVQDPCHLRHVQRAHLPVRTVLARYVDVVELDDEGLCCGAGGAYSVLHPDMSRDIRSRKLASIDRSATALVASANPGCSMHLCAAGVDARHPLVIIDALINQGNAAHGR